MMKQKEQRSKAREIFTLHAEKFDNEKPYPIEEIINGCIGMAKDMQEMGIAPVYIGQCIEYFRQYFGIPEDRFRATLAEMQQQIEHQLHSLS